MAGAEVVASPYAADSVLPGGCPVVKALFPWRRGGRLATLRVARAEMPRPTQPTIQLPAATDKNGCAATSSVRQLL